MQSFGFNSLPFCNLQDGFCVWFCLSHSNFRFFLFSNRKNTKLWTNKIRESKFMIQIWWLMACVFAFLVNKTVWNLVNSQIEICKLESWVTFALAGFRKQWGECIFLCSSGWLRAKPVLVLRCRCYKHLSQWTYISFAENEIGKCAPTSLSKPGVKQHEQKNAKSNACSWLQR